MKAAREEGAEEWHEAAAAWCDVETDIRNRKTETRHHDRAEAKWHENMKRTIEPEDRKQRTETET